MCFSVLLVPIVGFVVRVLKGENARPIWSPCGGGVIAFSYLGAGCLTGGHVVCVPPFGPLFGQRLCRACVPWQNLYVEMDEMLAHQFCGRRAFQHRCPPGARSESNTTNIKMRRRAATAAQTHLSDRRRSGRDPGNVVKTKRILSICKGPPSHMLDEKVTRRGCQTRRSRALFRRPFRTKW